MSDAPDHDGPSRADGVSASRREDIPRDSTDANWPPSGPTSIQQHVVFSGAGELYGITMDRVDELIPLPALVQLPECPDVIEGFLNLSGSAIPVIRLDRLFGRPRGDDHLYTPLLILRSEEGRVALLVDQIQGIVALEQVVPISRYGALNDCAQCMAVLDGRTVIVLDPDCLLLEQEIAYVERLKERAQERLVQFAGDPA